MGAMTVLQTVQYSLDNKAMEDNTSEVIVRFPEWVTGRKDKYT